MSELIKIPDALLLHDSDAQFSQLAFCDRSRGFYHQVLGGGSFGEGDYFSEAFCTCENHDDAVEAECDSSVWRCAVLECFEEESEAGTRFLFGHAEGMENFPLNVLPV